LQSKSGEDNVRKRVVEDKVGRAAMKRSLAALRAWRPSEMKLAQIDIAPEYQDWFARNQIQYISWFPLITHNLVIFAILMVLVGPHIGVIGVILAGIAVASIIVRYRLTMVNLARTDTPDHCKNYGH
jgi:hypothetical protein